MLKLIKISLSLAIFFSVLSFSQLNANTVSDNNYNNVQPTNFYEDYPENYQEDTIQQLKAQMLLGNRIKVVSDQVDLALASENQMELDIAKEIIKDLEESNEKTALLSKLDNLEADIEATSALVRALDAANYAFESKDQADIDYARQLLEPYKDTYEGDNALYF